jgi:hypothetical protein
MRPQNLRKFFLVGIVSILCLFSIPFAASASSGNGTAKLSPSILMTTTTTTNKCPDCWAGYGVSGTGLTSVSTHFVIPTVTCPSSGTAGVAFLVAIDGGSATDFALAGIEAICSSGTLSLAAVWYNAATDTSGSGSFTPAAGDHVSASIKETGSNFVFVVKDGTNKLTGKASDSGAANSYATCFTDMFTGYALANFGTVKFQSCLVNGAGVGQTTQTLVKWVDVNSAATSVLASPGKLSGTNMDNFAVHFKAAGP